MRSALSLVPLAALAFTLLTPEPAAACWDGLLVERDNMFVQIDVSTPWYVDVQIAADWVTRIDALLPAGAELTVTFGLVDIVDPQGTCVMVTAEEVDDFEAAFARVASACGSSEAEIAAARDLEGELFTLQLLSTRDRAKAEATVEAINESQCEWQGFYSEGAFPGANRCAELETIWQADGREVHRVLVGNYLDRVTAELDRAEISGELGIEAMVRSR
jgi:hypothetical protein